MKSVKAPAPVPEGVRKDTCTRDPKESETTRPAHEGRRVGEVTGDGGYTRCRTQTVLVPGRTPGDQVTGDPTPPGPSHRRPTPKRGVVGVKGRPDLHCLLHDLFRRPWLQLLYTQ